MIWSGTDANVPSGWHICDGGTYGGLVTPDLRDRFVIGAGTTYAVNATGGALTTAISGSLTVGSHAITADEMPIHTHGFTDYYNGMNTGITNVVASGPVGDVTSRNDTTGATGGGSAHGHAGSTITLNDISTLPLYYALYYIMKYA